MRQVPKDLKALYAELQTLQWIGADKGWDAAIDAVSARIALMLATPAPIPDHSEDVRTMVVPDGYALIPIESLARFPEINPANYGDDEVMALNNWAIDLVLAASPSAKEASQ